MDVITEKVTLWLLENAPFAALCLVAYAVWHLFVKRRMEMDTHGANMADRMADRLSRAEDRLTALEEENIYLRQTVAWMSGHISDLNTHWTDHGRTPPQPRYPAPPTPRNVKSVVH